MAIKEVVVCVYVMDTLLRVYCLRMSLLRTGLIDIVCTGLLVLGQWVLPIVLAGNESVEIPRTLGFALFIKFLICGRRYLALRRRRNHPALSSPQEDSAPSSNV